MSEEQFKEILTKKQLLEAAAPELLEACEIAALKIEDASYRLRNTHALLARELLRELPFLNAIIRKAKGEK